MHFSSRHGNRQDSGCKLRHPDANYGQNYEPPLGGASVATAKNNGRCKKSKHRHPKTYDKPKLISRILLHTLPQLKDDGENISASDLEKVLNLFKKGEIVKEGIPKSLIQSSKNEEIEIITNISSATSNYFGYNVFTGDPELFQQSYNESVDPNYVIGPGDEVEVY